MINKKLKKLEQELLQLKPKDHNVDIEETRDFILNCDIPQECKEDILNNLDTKKPHGIDFSKLSVDTLKKTIAAFRGKTLIIDDVTYSDN